MWFCGDLDCLKDDADHSLAQKRDQKAPETPKCASGRFGVGSRYFNAHVSKLRLTNEYKEMICRWTNNPKHFLVVLGVPGTGKTYLCMALANFFLEKGKQVKYLNGRRFFEEVQNAIQQGKSQYEKIRQIANNDILILDDIGASTNSEWQKEVVLDLIDHRYNEQKTTIITSNMSEKDMIQNLGDRTTRRMFSPENLIISCTEVYNV